MSPRRRRWALVLAATAATSWFAARADERDERARRLDEAIEAHRARIAAVASHLDARPEDQSLYRYTLEFEAAVAHLPLDGARASSHDELAEACRDADLLVYGELHRWGVDHLEGVLRALARAMPARPRVLMHEFLAVEWTSWLARVNGTEGGAAAGELVALARDSYLAALDRHDPAGVQRDHVAAGVERSFGHAAAVCSRARAHGFEVAGAVTQETIDRTVRLLTLGETTGEYVPLQRLRDAVMRERAAAVAARPDRPLVVLVAGEHHALGAERVAERWVGRPPVVMITRARLVLFEQHRRGLGEAAVVRLTPRVFFAHSGGHVLSLYSTLPPPEERDR